MTNHILYDESLSICQVSSIGSTVATMSNSELALIKNLCLCYCDNKPGMMKRNFKRFFKLSLFVCFYSNFLEILDKLVNTVSHLLHSYVKIFKILFSNSDFCSERGTIYQDDIRLLDKIWKHCMKKKQK